MLDGTNKFQGNTSCYTEDILLMGDVAQLNDSEQNAVDAALSNNHAVGVVAGSYEEGLPITMASSFFMNSLGLTADDFNNSNGVSLLSLIHEDDVDQFEPEAFRVLAGNFEFRMMNKQGEAAYVYAYKTESVNGQGQPEWVLSTRVSYESVGVNQFVQSLSHLIERYIICDIARNRYEFFCYKNGESYLNRGVYSNLAEGMIEQLGITSNIDDLTRALSPESIHDKLKTMDHLYRYDYAAEDESVFYRMAIVPQEFKDGEPSKFIVFVMDVTDAHREEIRMQHALMEAYQAANKANDAKSRFLSNVSHDIRTPMNAIIGMTAIASAHIDERERALDALGKITTSSRHLLGLINEVLDMSRIEQDRLALNNENFSLPELIDALIEMVKPSVVAREHNFDVRVQNIQHEDVIGDSLRIQQVFTNIVNNAVKYTPDGGTITVTISEKPTHKHQIGCYEFSVEDSGIGMSPEFLTHIFEPFSRAENADDSSSQGTGLGMSIAQSIVRMMDGDIKVESTLGKGTKVTTTIFLQLQEDANKDDDLLANLPILVVDDDEISCESTVETIASIGMQGEWVNNGPAAIQRVEEKHSAQDDFYAIIVDWKMPGMDGIETTRRIRKVVGPDITIIMLTAYDFAEVEAEAREAGVNQFMTKPLFRSRLKSVFKHLVTGTPASPVVETAAKDLPIGDYSDKRILVVEDNMLNREILIEILSETNAEIETAVNGKVAVDLVADNPEGYYDLVFMDIQMPVMNGYDATTAIRALPNGKGATLPIVALTANAFAEDVVMAKNAGANEHVAKPVDINRLAEVMRTWIR